MGAIVNGLLIHTNTTLMGKFALKSMAEIAAAIICEGIGMAIQNKPITNALATEWRLRCQIFGLCNKLPKTPKPLVRLSFSGFGK